MLQIRLLGRVEVSVAGAPLAGVRGKSGWWLLGILTLCANRPVERNFLAGVLWPDSSPEVGRANLRRALTDLRRALKTAAPRLISPTPQTVLLQIAPNEADVLAFRAGDGTQYGGELMPGCPLEWVETERRVLEETYLKKGELQAAVLAPDAALVLLEKLRACSPLRESLLRLQLHALCQQGNRAEAQQVYHRFRRSLLEQRLGEPSLQTQEAWKSLQSLPAPTPPSNADAAPVSPPAAAASSLSAATAPPTPLTPFLGRKSELEMVARLLSQNRLVTLVGLGGMGKTRLAIESARDKHSLFLELAECREAAQFAQRLADLPPPDEPTLLVLDNFEQLVGPEANKAVRVVLEKHPNLRCLVTSRRALGLTGEQVLPVEPLDLPQHPGSPERLQEFASMALLVERARALNPAFELHPHNASTLVALCQITEGIPLALELLAAHLRSLPPEILLAQVQQARLPLLARKGDGETPRHQSLWRIIASSVALLDSAHQTGFGQLAVFCGGWSLEAAQAVCGNETPADPLFLVGLLETLTDSSLIRFDSGRYRLLETLREWSVSVQPESVGVRARQNHAVFFLAFAEKHANRPDGLAVLDTEVGNLRAAFDTFLAGGDTASALRWVRALRLYWFHRQGGQPLLETLLARLGENADADAERAELQDCLGVLCAMSGAYEAATQHFNAALNHFRRVGNPLAQAKILSNLAGMAIERGDFDQALTGLEEALLLWRTLNQPKGLGVTLTNLSIVLMNQGDLQAAEPLINEALTLRQAQNDQYGIATALVNRGSLELKRGESSQAEITYRAALEKFHALGDRRGEAVCLEGLVEVYLGQNNFAQASRFFQEVAWLRQEYHLPVTALQMELHARIREALGAAASDTVQRVVG